MIDCNLLKFSYFGILITKWSVEFSLKVFDKVKQDFVIKAINFLPLINNSVTNFVTKYISNHIIKCDQSFI